MKTIYHWGSAALTTVLLGCMVFLLFRVETLRKEIGIKEQIIADISENTMEIAYLESNLHWNLTGERLDLSGMGLMDASGNEVAMRDLGESPVLVYRFHENDCQSCISFGFTKLDVAARRHGLTPIVMAQFADNFHFRRWRPTSEGEAWKAYNMPAALPPDKIMMPYFFVLHPDQTIGELFIPDKSSPGQTNRYLKIISEKYRF